MGVFRRRLGGSRDGWADYMAARGRDTRAPLLQRYYGVPLPAPETPLAEVPLVALDIETTGLDPARDAIVSIGAVPFSLHRIPLAQRRYWLVRPPGALSSRSVTFHHITHSDIEHAPDLAAVLPELLDLLAGRLPVVHFRGIERGFLDAGARARLGEALVFPVIDTMSIEARRYRLSAWHRLRRWFGRPPVSIRLNDSRQRYGLPAYQPHHALVDAIATAELLQAQIATHYRPTVTLGQFWC